MRMEKLVPTIWKLCDRRERAVVQKFYSLFVLSFTISQNNEVDRVYVCIMMHCGVYASGYITVVFLPIVVIKTTTKYKELPKVHSMSAVCGIEVLFLTLSRKSLKSLSDMLYEDTKFRLISSSVGTEWASSFSLPSITINKQAPIIITITKATTRVKRVRIWGDNRKAFTLYGITANGQRRRPV